MPPPPPRSTLFPYTTLFRSRAAEVDRVAAVAQFGCAFDDRRGEAVATEPEGEGGAGDARSEEHTSELHHPSISYAVFCLKKKNSLRHRSTVIREPEAWSAAD